MPYPTDTLKVGDRGEAVRQLQAGLNRDYPAYSKLVVDGDFGPATEAVIREFQRRAGLPVDGVAGFSTLAKLEEFSTEQQGAAIRTAATAFMPDPTRRVSSRKMFVRNTFRCLVTRLRSTSTARSLTRPTP